VSDSQVYPVNPLPVAVIALFAIIMGVEGIFQLGTAGLIGGPQAVGWRLGAIQDYAFSPAVWEQITVARNWSFGMLQRFVTYSFIHGSFTHAIFAGVLLLALGKFVGEVLGPFAMLAVFFAAAIGGAVVFGMLVAGNMPLYGAYPGVYGLIGAYTYILWLKLAQTGGNRIAAFRMIGFLMAIQLVFGLIFGSQPTWIADVAGFVFGGAMSVLVAPGGWRALVVRLRQR
jgi:membrane associated rhomboid family serine protease